MGYPPGFFQYEAGSVCLQCHPTLFNGRTPQWVELTLSGLIICPDVNIPPPHGTWLLNQVAPCTWYYECPPYHFTWILGVDRSILSVTLVPVIQFFWSMVMDTCIDEFENELIDCEGGNLSRLGTGKLRWGPTIGPQSSFIQWEVGDACCICQHRIFSGFTPRDVQAEIKNIYRCPLWFGPRPNGLYVLTQIDACTWQMNGPLFIMTWTLANTTSRFLITDMDAHVWFDRIHPNVCGWYFTGGLGNTCGLFGVYGYLGTAEITWGPWVVP